MGFSDSAKTINARKKADQLMPFIKHNMRVLDFGCGDLSLSKELVRRDKTLSITGVDVVDFNVKDIKIHFQKYDGKKIPYTHNAFDVVISYHVLHHTDKPIGFLNECLRVCRGKLLLVEPVYRHPVEIFGMTFMDWIFNVWKDRSIAMTYAFQSKTRWMQAIEARGWKIEKIIDVELLPAWFPTGRSYLFVCKKIMRKSLLMV